jgi:hypothetical protein
MSVLTCTCFFLVLLSSSQVDVTMAFDLASGILEAPDFKGKDPISKLRAAAGLLRSNKIKQSDVGFLLLDWGDQYLREPKDPLERLRRWSELMQDKTLSHLKIPRDFLNRGLLAEYLVTKTPYLDLTPRKRLELIRRLEQENLVDWSVALAYSRLYAGAVVSGAKEYDKRTPLEAVASLKKLEDEDLVSWHYGVPTEAILIAEALAMDEGFKQANPLDRLIKLRDLERKNLITTLNKKEMEKLPAWRFLVGDPTFLKANANMKRKRLLKLRNEGLISAPTYKDLTQIFIPASAPSSTETTPTSPLSDQTVPQSE